MDFGISTLIPFFAVIIYASILVIVMLSRPQTPAKVAFRIYLLAMFCWSATALIVVLGLDDQTFWFRLMSACIMGVAFATFYFVQISLAKSRKWVGGVYIYGLIILIPTVFTNLMVKYATVNPSGIDYEFGPLMVVAAGGGYLIYVFSLIEMINELRKTVDQSQRNRLKYLMLGLGIIILFSLVNFTPLGKYPIDVAGNVLAAFVFTYAVLRHQLLDIEVVIRKSLIYFIPTTIIGTSYFLIVTLVIRVFEVLSGAEILLTSMLVAIFSAIIVQPLRDRAQAWVDKLFFREKYDSSLMLQRVSKTAASYLEIDMLANMILNEVVSTLHIEKAAFFLKDNPSDEYRIISHRNLDQNTNIRLRSDHPVVLKLLNTEQAITKRETDILPEFKSLLDHEKEFLDTIGAELFIPLKVQGNLIGILIFGQKRSEQAYSQDDQSTVITLANQTAVAFENARLFTVEQTRRKEMDSLYTLSRELIATDAMNSVLDSVVEQAHDIIHVTFTRILLHEDDRSYRCRAIHPVYSADFDLRLGQKDPKSLYRFYEQSLTSDEPLVLYQENPFLKEEERRALYLEHVQSICICPLRIGEEPIGILILGERRQTNRESFDMDKLRLTTAIADQASSAIQRAMLHEQLEESFIQTVVALANAIDARDSYTSDHSERLIKLATSTANLLGCTQVEIQAINWAMRLHDIGKIGIPDEILQKPGPLSVEEWKMMQMHPEVGADILTPVTRLKDVAP